MASTFLVRCSFCPKSFRSRRSAETHVVQRHPGEDLPLLLSFRLDDKEALLPSQQRIKNNIRYQHYLEWLGDLVEGLNSAHIPKAPAKWYQVTMTSVPLTYLEHLLHNIQSVTVNSVKEVKHMKPPMWKERVQKVSYKTYSLGDVQRAFNEQHRVPLKLSKSFNGTREIAEREELFGREALEAAKMGRLAQNVTMKTEIIIDEGKGRLTRECELIWWPLYDNSRNGNLTVRLFIGKIHI